MYVYISKPKDHSYARIRELHSGRIVANISEVRRHAAEFDVII